MTVITALLVPVARAVAADGPPYHDPAVVGGITLLDAQGRAVTSGGLVDTPLAASAVGSTTAPPPYDGAGRKATLIVAQPRQGVPPSQWNTVRITYSTAYEDPARPTARGRAANVTLGYIANAFPPQWQGYLQLRLILSASGTAPRLDAYDALDVRVGAGRWQLATAGAGGLGVMVPVVATASAVLALGVAAAAMRLLSRSRRRTRTVTPAGVTP